MTYVFAIPLQKADQDEDELSFDDLDDEDATQKPKENSKPVTYIQRIPPRSGKKIQKGEELKKCLTGEPEKGHPHLVKTDIEDVASVLIAHTKNKPEHERTFDDIPEVVETSSVHTLTTEATVVVSAPKRTILIDDDEKIRSEFQFRFRRKRSALAHAKPPTKVRRPKLKTTEKKTNEMDTTVKSETKPEPIPIALHEVAGFDKIKIKKKIQKRDVEPTIVKRSHFIRPKPVSEILKHHAIQPAKKEE